MPWVIGHGVWPVGEEWLYEAAATSYLPLADLLECHPGKVTLSVTPVLAEQLRDSRAQAGLTEYVNRGREEAHSRAYEPAANMLRDSDLADLLAAHTTWSSAATHAVLPLLATDAGLDLQIGESPGAGFWLPECAYAQAIEPALGRAGVRVVCVDLSGIEGDEPGLPIATAAGPVLVPIDRGLVDMVWGVPGIPGAGPYRDSNRWRDDGHRGWANDGLVYSAERAAEQVAVDARDFVDAVLAHDGLSVFAIDAELLGHHWYEGVGWLKGVMETAFEQGLGIVQLNEAAIGETRKAVLPPTSWGADRDLSTWSGPPVADIAFATRAAELRVLRSDPDPERLRELQLLQSSDWAFMASRDTAAQYGRERFSGHLKGL
jgi:1,4-alpha-glucan branching enzyme